MSASTPLPLRLTLVGGVGASGSRSRSRDRLEAEVEREDEEELSRRWKRRERGPSILVVPERTCVCPECLSGRDSEHVKWVRVNEGACKVQRTQLVGRGVPPTTL